MKNSRRRFLESTALTSGAILSGNQTAYGATSNKPNVDLIRVGVMAVGDYSHLNSKGAIWAPVINPTEPDRWPCRTTRMLITHCWDSRAGRAREFAQRYKCTAVEHYDDMVSEIDALITGGMYECRWWPKLTKPYLEAGIPTFINRPFALSMHDAKEMVETAKKHKTPIMSTDAHEDLESGLVARGIVHKLRREIKTIFGASATTNAHEYPAHMVHGLYLVLSVFGLNVEQVSLQAPGWWQEKTQTNSRRMDWGMLTLQYSGIEVDNAEPQNKPFLVTVHAIDGSHGSRSTLRIYYQGGFDNFDHHIIPGDLINNRYHLQSKTVFDMQRMFESGEMPQSYDDILRKTRIFLTGFKSHIDHGGIMVPVNSVSDNWEAPSPYPDWIDESIFR